jgi:CO/xanthine dehydrogenase Mo-binding subunit
MAAQVVHRPVKFALARKHMFAVAGYRTPTIQRIRLGADNDGRLTAIAHDVVEQTSTLQEFAEQTAIVTRMMYAAPNRSTTHRLARLNVPTPAWMRARLEEVHGVISAGGLVETGEAGENPEAKRFSMHTFGAQFTEVRVNLDSGEVCVPRLLGVFAAGRIMNAKTARSQFLGGMTMGLSMAFHEESIMDPHFGDYVNHDLAEYHIATNADVGTIDISWIDEDDPYVNPLGAKGIGEIGILGTAAAIANAVYHATGIRVRDLPITLDKFLK